jgi:hypothetical protein
VAGKKYYLARHVTTGYQTMASKQIVDAERRLRNVAQKLILLYRDLRPPVSPRPEQFHFSFFNGFFSIWPTCTRNSIPVWSFVVQRNTALRE